MIDGHYARHHTIVVVDVAGFGDRRRTNIHQVAVRGGLYRVMHVAFDMIGVRWADCHVEDRGDGLFVLAPAEAPKAAFAASLLSSMIRGLRAHNDACAGPEQIRLRLALHAGEVHHDGHGVTSAALTHAFRLVDSDELKAALAASRGMLAVVVSDWFYEDVVRHHPATAPDTYRPVWVSHKETRATAWLALPDCPFPPALVQPEPRPWVVPRQLPLRVRDFTGRGDHLAALDALLAGSGTSLPPPVVISAVDGAAGIGKTALAVHWAHLVQDKFPDGTLYANLRGYGPGEPAAAGEVLDGFLRALGTPAERMPAGVDAQAALYRSLLRGRRVLIVLDNANSADQVRPLLPGSGGCVVVVTSRDSLNGLVVFETAHRLTLDLLTPAEARTLVTGIIGTERADTETGAVAELIVRCAWLPLALRIAAGRVAAHPRITVAEVVAQLAKERNRLDVLSRGGDERAAVRNVFGWSYQQLPARHAQIFRRLGLHPGPDISIPAASVLGELDETAANELLDGLANTHLIERSAGGRYRFHDLLRVYAADLSHEIDAPEVRDHALHALLEWYANIARTCEEILYPHNPHISTQQRSEGLAHISDRAEALAWLETERANLMAALRAADHADQRHNVLKIAESMRFLHTAGSWDDLLDVENCAVDLARRWNDRIMESFFLCWRGDTYTELRRMDLAANDIEGALTLADTLSDPTWHAWALNARARMSLYMGQFNEANRDLHEALQLVNGVDTGRLVAVLEGNLCEANIGIGTFHAALVHGERSLDLRRQLGDLNGEPHTLHLLARVWAGLGEHTKAIELCRRAIELGRTVGRFVDAIVEPLDTLGVALLQTGRPEAAIACWREAATLFHEYGRHHQAHEARERIRAALAKPDAI
jgi:tetratricopeptide (TPR) repeat protein